MIWQRYPIFRIFLSLSSGILLANFFVIPYTPFILLFFISLIGVISFGFFKQTKQTYQFLYGGLFILFFLSVGILSSHLYSEKIFDKNLNSIPPDSEAYLIKITEQPLEKRKSIGIEAKLKAYLRSDSIVKASTGLMLYLQKSAEAKAITYGDILWVYSKMNKIQSPKNPYEFDYKKYLNLKAIYYQIYADSTSWEKVIKNHAFDLKGWAIRVRLQLLKEIQSWNISEREKTVSQALLLGYRSNIDNKLLKAYSSAGVIHVLAVSGLHVGIVYMVFSYLLFFLKNMPGGSFIKTSILVVLLWVYALITGLSPSVVRAVTMFTFVAIGSGFKRSTCIYNTLLASAIFLLLIKPTYLFEVGFQLSYAAVFGIVWMQPHFKRLWQFRHWLTRQIWIIITVSLAAQIIISPLGLYYFHQFPSLFLISNLFVIPLITILMYSGLLTLILSISGILPFWLLKSYDFLLWLMNESVRVVESFSFFSVDSIHLGHLELILIYLVIFLGFSWFISGSVWKILTTFVCIFLLMLYQVWENYHLNQQRSIVVYSVNKHRAIGLYYGSKGVFLADSMLLEREDALAFYVKHHWWSLNLKKISRLNIESNYHGKYALKYNNRLRFAGNDIWLYEQGEHLPKDTEVWIVYHSWTNPPDEEIENLPGQVILCEQLKLNRKENWLRWAKEHQIKVHLLEKGAWTLSL